MRPFAAPLPQFCSLSLFPASIPALHQRDGMAVGPIAAPTSPHPLTTAGTWEGVGGGEHHCTAAMTCRKLLSLGTAAFLFSHNYGLPEHTHFL